MSETERDPGEKPFVEDRDREYAESAEDADQQDLIACTVQAYRREDRLEAGDPAPALEMIDLATGEPVALAPRGDRPLALFFGSYT